MYPNIAEINGKEYKIDTSWQTALECFHIIEDESICDEERALAIVYKLFGFIPNEEEIELFLEKAIKYLQCGEEYDEQVSKVKDMDFEQDFKYINASFMSDYHIDLSKENIHFWQFIYLIQGLTEGCILSRIRNLRNYDESEISDAKERSRIIEAKKSVALKKREEVTPSQRKNQERFFELTGIRR